jgi:mannose-6-phosphate isomerase-like protein (cupin superfamily)
MNATTKRRALILTAAASLGIFSILLFVGRSSLHEKDHEPAAAPTATPAETADYNHPPKLKFDPNDYFFKFDQLEEAFRAPGEYTHRLEGEKYGFSSMSFIITKTQPNAGPNLHVHDVEEAHVLLEGTAEYRIGDKTFTVDAPYVVKVPAGTPHTFINAGAKPFNLVAVFASKNLVSKRIGPNPLIHAMPKK